jgi:predicted nucleic acid-binding protein
MRHFAPSHGLDNMDAIIAATAEHHQLKLAAPNVKPRCSRA